jgi:hypothetical protein
MAIEELTQELGQRALDGMGEHEDTQKLRRLVMWLEELRRFREGSSVPHIQSFLGWLEAGGASELDYHCTDERLVDMYIAGD